MPIGVRIAWLKDEIHTLQLLAIATSVNGCVFSAAELLAQAGVDPDVAYILRDAVTPKQVGRYLAQLAARAGQGHPAGAESIGTRTLSGPVKYRPTLVFRRMPAPNGGMAMRLSDLTNQQLQQQQAADLMRVLSAKAFSPFNPGVLPGPAGRAGCTPISCANSSTTRISNEKRQPPPARRRMPRSRRR